MAEHWPVIFPCNKFSYFLNAKVIYKWIVVILTNEFYPDDFWDVKKVLVVQDTFDILPILDWLFRSKFPRLFILAL